MQIIKHVLAAWMLTTLALSGGVLAAGIGGQRGTVEAIEKTPHGMVVTISGKRYQYDDSVRITVEDTLLSYGNLEKGQEVRYTTHFPMGTGAAIQSITIIGPADVLQYFRENGT